MLLKTHRWLLLFGAAAFVCAALSVSAGVASAQATDDIEVVPTPADNPKNVGEFAPVKWEPEQGEHPGKKLFASCAACHTLGTDKKVGPGLAGMADRVPERERLLKFIENPKATDGDQYFKDLRASFADMMAAQGRDAGGALTREQILLVIDYILRHRAKVPTMTPEQLDAQVKLGRDLVSGTRGFAQGGPACVGCHTIGSDKDLRGGNVGPNIAHAYVLARANGSKKAANFSDGLAVVLIGPEAPKMHEVFQTADNKPPFTDEELDAMAAFFERTARQVGTERESNYLPIFALILAALAVLLLDGSLFGKLFVKEKHEYVDGPYAADKH